jgi:hypothetical protein
MGGNKMRYVNKVTGEVREIGGQMSSGQMSGGLSNLDALKQLFGMEMLSKAKKTSDIVSAFQLLTPKEPTVAEYSRREKEKESTSKLNDIQYAINLLTQGNKTGPISGNILRAKTQFLGGATPQERDLYNIVGEIAAKKMFELGGKVLPAQEMARLEPFIPTYTKPTETNINDLTRMMQELRVLYGNPNAWQYPQVSTGMVNTPSSFVEE